MIVYIYKEIDIYKRIRFAILSISTLVPSIYLSIDLYIFQGISMLNLHIFMHILYVF